jgi:hypothetical protein
MHERRHCECDKPVDPHWTLILYKEKFSLINKNGACSELSHILFLSSAATLNIFGHIYIYIYIYNDKCCFMQLQKILNYVYVR